MQKYILRLLLVITMNGLFMIAYSQPPRNAVALSSQLVADKKVSSRYLAPFAKEVGCAGSQPGAVSLPMQKGSPGLYTCNATIDGITVMDTANVDFSINERFKASLPDVPGFSSWGYATRNVSQDDFKLFNYY